MTLSLKWKDTKIGSKADKVNLSKDHKYRDRERCIRVQQEVIDKFLEDFKECDPVKVLDVAAGNGVFIEMMNNLGHDACGTEKPGTPYEVFHKSQKTNIIYHDTTDLPMPFKKKEFDLVCCVGAFDFYPEDKWNDILKDFFRVAKSTVFVALNRGEKYERNADLFSNPISGWKMTFKKGSHYRWDKK